jgi:hypothetical protein
VAKLTNKLLLATVTKTRTQMRILTNVESVALYLINPEA